MKHFKKVAAMVAACTLCGSMLLASCTAVSVKGDLVLNQDGTGSRTITGVIAKNDNNSDGFGSAYYYLTKHGSELESYVETVYSVKISGSADWLTVTVDDSSAEQETISLSFEFTSFADYTTKLGALVQFGDEEASYVAPTLVENDNGSVTYTESTTVLTSVYKALQTYIMNDDEIFDFDCTIDGEKTNTDPMNDFDTLLSSGVELDKLSPLTVKIGSGKATALTADGDSFTLTANWDGSPVAEHVTECVLDYTFNDTLNNAGTLGADGNLTLGTGSSQTSATYVEGIDGKGYYFDGTTYLASGNRTFSYDELTVSFYYKMEEYFETDTGANMVIVPAGLGALGGGVIDLEFIKEDGEDGVQMLVKMNSSNWQVQDKMYTDEYIALNEWHCYTVVFQNVYDDDGEIDSAYVSLYVDGERVQRMELSVAAGLKYSLGSYDDGTAGTPNGGFNVGGYYENETVKRGCKGVLDNLKVFDGALSAEEVKTLCYTVPVNNGGSSGGDSGNSSTDDNSSGNGGCGSVLAGGALAIVSLGGAAVIVFRKRK